MSSKETDSSDLSRPTFTRVSLAAAERSVIEREFSSYVDEVVGMINDGKEATVYLCRARPTAEVEYVAAKMYRARKVRAFSNEATYVNPDKVHDRRMAKAMPSASRTQQSCCGFGRTTTPICRRSPGSAKRCRCF